MLWKIVVVLWRIVVVVVGTLFVLLVASSIWGGSREPGMAVDIRGAVFLRSPFYWVMVAAIVFIAGWLLKRWLHLPKS